MQRFRAHVLACFATQCHDRSKEEGAQGGAMCLQEGVIPHNKRIELNAVISRPVR